MREIKFRVWDSREKKMAHKLKLDWMGGTPELNDAIATIQRENVVLMQFTGLRDRNRKEIYEGDVVSGAYYQGRTVVEWVGDHGWTVKSYHMDAEGKIGSYPTAFIEVIGNIYENPELLQG